MDGFNWRKAVERYGDELCAIAAQLIVMAGMQGFRVVETLPRHLYLRILSILRPAEYAARRLILMAACKIIGAHQRASAKLNDGTENPDSGLPLTKEESAPNSAISSSPHGERIRRLMSAVN
jgi:hypothetical protein